VRVEAPALVAVDVPTGTDHVVLRFHGYGGYPELFALSGLTLTMVAVAPWCCVRAIMTSEATTRSVRSSSRGERLRQRKRADLKRLADYHALDT